MITIVPATAEHVITAWGGNPPMTFTAISLLDGERLLGVAGFFPDEWRHVLVSKITDETREDLKRGRYRKAVLMASRRVMAMARERNMPVHAVPDPNVYGSENLLRHLGFEPFQKGVWSCPN